MEAFRTFEKINVLNPQSRLTRDKVWRFDGSSMNRKTGITGCVGVAWRAILCLTNVWNYSLAPGGTFFVIHATNSSDETVHAANAWHIDACMNYKRRARKIRQSSICIFFEVSARLDVIGPCIYMYTYAINRRRLMKLPSPLNDPRFCLSRNTKYRLLMLPPWIIKKII